MEDLYTLEKEVGRGSYGVVFEGLISKTGQKVAIKRLPCKDPECIELYLQELWAMRTTAKNHINVIALHSCLLQTGRRSLKPLRKGKLPLHLVESVLKGSVGHDRGSQCNTRRRTNSVSRLQDRTNIFPSNPPCPSTPKRPSNRSRKRLPEREDEQTRSPCCSALWLVMEYCDGGDLNQYLLSRPPDVHRNHSVVQQLSSAVAFLHHLGIIHRDLKPDNVLVSVTPNGPIFKVADFGLSKISEGLVRGNLGRKHFSSTCGSDFYMAPEVWGGLTYTAQADIFSLGVMFWAVLERITFLEEGTTHEQLGAYVCKGRWLTPLGEALWENADLQLCIPMKWKRAAPPPSPPGPAMCGLLLDMLASNPDSRPVADQLESRVCGALKEDSH
ncbi:serine/threonine-protein kinase PDIK1L isoform X1 [Hippocampus comes]|uniref:Si:ch211-63o20.7 n=1 Tax=Hippocampus comes TaxID=109280 RepID=A0A3Q2XRQ7_HIPCM|nr:PREDICTED: serine/threonine-protein kinase PDIK1L-like isoform X1 [Hippocampus comes]XP_019713541.1 PREDICTED: serine/threonine-protein kinase PDIK1L-like isoform X1 [Hippocampus comes]XP_019713542.1 PREDICTED: serine/threonine-protein kinase PDIK1L-like isoform X1 [Hippocampus comes]